MDATPILPVEGARLARQWGFPREITQRELESEWYTTTKGQAIIWLEPSFDPQIYGVHLAVNPLWRKRGWNWLRALHFLEERVLTLSPEPSGILVVLPPCGGILPYLPRLGFERFPQSDFWVKPLGEMDMGGIMKLFGGLFGGAEAPAEEEKDPTVVIASDAATAAEAERKRKARRSDTNRRSGKASTALSASIGRTSLGGGS